MGAKLFSEANRVNHNVDHRITLYFSAKNKMGTTQMPIINFLLRSFYYFRTGYSIYLSLPLTMISLCTTVYYLAIQNMPTLKNIFPSLLEFGLALIVVVYPGGALAGWLHFKKMPFYRIEQSINVDSNPYSQTKLAPVMIPMWKTLMGLAVKEGLDVSEMQKILEAS